MTVRYRRTIWLYCLSLTILCVLFIVHIFLSLGIFGCACGSDQLLAPGAKCGTLVSRGELADELLIQNSVLEDLERGKPIVPVRYIVCIAVV